MPARCGPKEIIKLMYSQLEKRLQAVKSPGVSFKSYATNFPNSVLSLFKIDDVELCIFGITRAFFVGKYLREFTLFRIMQVVRGKNI